MTDAIDYFYTLPKEYFLSDAQWVTLAHMHMESERPIQDILDGLHIEPNIDMPDKKQNFVGRIPYGKTGFLSGMLHYSGTTHT